MKAYNYQGISALHVRLSLMLMLDLFQFSKRRRYSFTLCL